MPTAAHVRIVKVRKWFPPHDALAAKIARHCILREDLVVELQGATLEKIEPLDDQSEVFRRMYFLRNMVRTQNELSGALIRLLGFPEFKALVAKQTPEVISAFRDAAKVIGRTHPITKEVRNEISRAPIRSRED